MASDLDRAVDGIVARLTAAGGLFEVSPATVAGVTYPAFAAAPATLRDYFAVFAARHGAREFLVHGDERPTFAETYARALSVAAALHARGVAKGDRVAIAMRNDPDWIASFIAVLHLGAVAVPLNARWQADELGYAVAHSGARLVVADDERARRVGGAAAVLTVPAALGHAPLDAAALPPIAPDDDATIFYTSGSTGTPRGAVSTHRATIAGALNFLVTGLALRELSKADAAPPEQEVMLLDVPLFHITGAVTVLLVSVAIGRKLVIMPRWDAGEALRLIAAERATYFVGVPTMTLELMNHPDRTRHDLSTLVDIASGGAPRPPEHVARLARAFPGMRPAQGYGLTETNAVGAGIYRDNYLAKPASTGRASKPLVDIGIFDEAMTPLPAGRIGEICIRSVANARGYWRDAPATAAAFVADGWFRTGDLGYLDADDYLFIVDRRKDIIIRGGENVSAQEVEAALYAHPAVAEASVFGVPDERLGEIVGAVVHVAPGAHLDAAALTAFVGGRLAAYKVPARLWFAAEPLPRLGSAKIDKRALRRTYL